MISTRRVRGMVAIAVLVALATLGTAVPPAAAKPKKPKPAGIARIKFDVQTSQGKDGQVLIFPDAPPNPPDTMFVFLHDEITCDPEGVDFSTVNDGGFVGQVAPFDRGDRHVLVASPEGNAILDFTAANGKSARPYAATEVSGEFRQTLPGGCDSGNVTFTTVQRVISYKNGREVVRKAG